MDREKTIKELVKAGFTEEQAVLLALRFITKEDPQKYSPEDSTLKIGELQLWLIEKFGELNREIIKTRIELKNDWMKWIPFVIPFVVIGIIVYLKTRI